MSLFPIRNAFDKPLAVIAFAGLAALLSRNDLLEK